jgi:hypothetical protein
MRRPVTFLSAITFLLAPMSGQARAALPDAFIGTFADLVPKIIGGTVPETRISMTSAQPGHCVFAIGDGAALMFKDASASAHVALARSALQYAKEHRLSAAKSYSANRRWRPCSEEGKASLAMRARRFGRPVPAMCAHFAIRRATS